MKITVDFTLSDDQVRRLEALLPFYHRYVGMKNWTVEELLQSIMNNAPEDVIDIRLHFVEQMIAEIKETPAVGAAGESKITNHI